MPTIYDRLNNVRDRVNRFIEGLASDDESMLEIPKEKHQDVGSYVTSLWNDAKKYYDNAFAGSAAERLYAQSPKDFIDHCKKLENGDDFEVFGHRDEDDGEHELTDGMISDQIRARKSFLTANWHDIIIQPDIKGINEILDQERKNTDWGKNARVMVAYMETFGDVWVKSCLDKSENPNGIALEKVLRPLSFFLTPGATGIKKNEGCWYATHGEEVNGQWVKENYPDIDLTKMSGTNTPQLSPSNIGDKTIESYEHTKTYTKIETYLDDPTLEVIPFKPEDFDARVGQLASDIENAVPGQPVETGVAPTKDDNHPKFIKAYQDWIEERANFYQQLEAQGLLTLDDAKKINAIFDEIETQIAMHEQANAQENMPEDQRLPSGKRKKYPFGRCIVTINGEVADDKPNPYLMEWRKLFHYIPNERVPERLSGRGDVEILAGPAYVQDTMLSRFADMGLQSVPKPWFHEGEKAKIEENGLNNNPKKPGYYVDRPPLYPTPPSGAAQSFLEAYKLSQGNSTQKLGINNITFGGTDRNINSGDQAQILLQQNSVIVTGEANQNLNDAIEDIVETRILMWKLFYTDKRPYFIDGEVQNIALNEYLTMQEVEENGQPVQRQIPAIQVTVRPDSNFPFRWENNMATLSQYAKLTYPDGTPVVPPQVFADLLAQKFPILKNPKYQVQSQAMQIGMQVMEQQQIEAQRAQKEQQDALDQVKNKIQNKRSSMVAEQIMGQQ